MLSQKLRDICRKHAFCQFTVSNRKKRQNRFHVKSESEWYLVNFRKSTHCVAVHKLPTNFRMFVFSGLHTTLWQIYLGFPQCFHLYLLYCQNYVISDGVVNRDGTLFLWKLPNPIKFCMHQQFSTVILRTYHTNLGFFANQWTNDATLVPCRMNFQSFLKISIIIKLHTYKYKLNYYYTMTIGKSKYSWMNLYARVTVANGYNIIVIG